MTTKVPDTVFPSPEEINPHPCVTADRWLNAVPEQVEIISVCQDSNNPSLVIFNIRLVGAFLFTPTLYILSVDGDVSYEANLSRGIFALGHYQNPTIPINTNCSVWHGQLVYDVGTVVNNYTSANTILFELEMAGVVPQAYGVSFPNQTCSTLFTWNKGVLPQPIGMTYTNGILNVQFNYQGSTNCNCSIQCVAPQGVTQNIVFCPGETQSVSLYQNPDSTDPFSVLIKLQDTLGNVSSVDFQTIFNVVPAKPILSIGKKPKRIGIAIARESISKVAIEPAACYQILKYEGSPNNKVVWKDWNDSSWNYFVDYQVRPGYTYGYAVKFKGQLGDISTTSEWTTVTI